MNSKHRNLTILFIALALIISPTRAIVSYEADISQDQNFCREYFPDIKNDMNYTFKPEESFSTTGPDSAEAIQKMINGQNFSYAFSHFDDLVLWIITSLFTVLGYTFCCGFGIFHLFRKKKILLNEEQIKKIRQKRNKGLNREDAQEDWDDDEDDLDIKNDPHKLEFKIFLYIKIALILLFGVSLYIVDRQFNNFFYEYVKISCKFTYTNEIFLKGDERNPDIDFMGLANLSTKLELMEGYMKNTTFTDFSDDIDNLATRVNNFVDQIETVYQDFKSRKISSPSAKEIIFLPFYTTWGPTTPVDSSNGLLYNFSMLVHKTYKNITGNLDLIKNSFLAPFEVSFRQKNVEDSISLKKIREMKYHVGNFTELLQGYNKDLSSSYLTRSFKMYNLGVNKILITIYGILMLSLIVNLMIELLYYKMRHNKILKFCSHLAWLFYGLFATALCIFLLYVTPVKFALSETVELIEPVALNESYFKKLDFPSQKLLSQIHGCFYSGGDFMSLNNSDISIKRGSELKNAIETTLSAMSSAKLSEIIVEFNNVKNVLLEYRNFNEIIYNPLSENNPAELLKKLNAMTDCNSDTYENYGFNINYANDCPSSTCQSTDHWVWDNSQCPAGSINWVYLTPKNVANRYCLNFGQLWAQDPAVHTRYPINCFETKSGNPYYSEITYILGNLKNHFTSIQSEMTLLDGDLSGMITGGTAVGINDINNLILNTLRPKVVDMEGKVSEFLDLTEEVHNKKNCSFVKNYWLELKDDLELVSNEMELASYLALSSVALLMMNTLISFLIGICFHQIHRPGKKIRNDQIMPLIKVNGKEEVKNKKDAEKFEKKIKKKTEKAENFDMKSEMSERKFALDDKEEEYSQESDKKEDLALKSKKSTYGRSTKAKSGNKRIKNKYSSIGKEGEEMEKSVSKKIGRFSGSLSGESRSMKKRSLNKDSSQKRDKGKGFKKIDDVDDDFIQSLKKGGFI